MKIYDKYSAPINLSGYILIDHISYICKSNAVNVGKRKNRHMFSPLLCSKFTLNATYRRKQIKSKSRQSTKRPGQILLDFHSRHLLSETACIKSLSLHCRVGKSVRQPKKESKKMTKKKKIWRNLKLHLKDVIAFLLQVTWLWLSSQIIVG